jgi:CCR4-NOT transcriptional complex subunit CAF120
MAASQAFSASSRSPLREEVQFPTLEPQRLPGKQQSPPTRGMAKHGRSNSFLPSFLTHRSQGSREENKRPRTTSLDDSAGGRGPAPPSPPARASGSKLDNGQQQIHQAVLHSQHSPATTGTMPHQQQPNPAAAYHQPLPPTPPTPNSPGGAAPGQTPGGPAPPVPGAQGQSTPLHPEIRSVVGLTVAHAHKIYFSGPLVRRIERQPDGQRPHKDEGWTEVWAQLGGTTLSIWDMKEVQEASRQGTEVPPIYVNVTDAVC